MTAKKFLIPFLLASLAGHALVLALTTGIDRTAAPRTEKVMTVALNTTQEKDTRPEPPLPIGGPVEGGSGGFREDSVSLKGEDSPYGTYLLLIRRKIERLWSYPPQALSNQEEGNTIVRFTIDADGSLSGYHVLKSSGSPALDEGALAVVRSAAPYTPFPASFKLSRLHITATFSYRVGG